MQAHGLEQGPIPGTQPIHNQASTKFENRTLVYNSCVLHVSIQIYCPRTILLAEIAHYAYICIYIFKKGHIVQGKNTRVELPFGKAIVPGNDRLWVLLK